jgi:alpha-ketoglutarate-dependent taurine dioxygenase
MTTATSLTTRLGADIRIEPLTTHIGSEVTGVDLAVPLDEDTRDALATAFAERHVLFFPGQSLDPGQLARAAAQFGELTQPSAVLPGVDGHPEVVELSNARAHAQHRATSGRETWHVDITFQQNPPQAALFQIATVPDVGGDTLFASVQAAYDALSEPIRNLIDPLTAIHDGGASISYEAANGEAGRWEGEEVNGRRPIEHPVVAVNPLNGRKGLFVNPQFTRRIVGLGHVESDNLLRLLFEQGGQPEFTVRRRWQAGDVALWDNRAIWHRRVEDLEYGVERVAYRVQLKGTPPVGP